MTVKILHGPKSRNLQALGLCIGERMLGLDSHILNYGNLDYFEPEIIKSIQKDLLIQLGFPSEWKRLSLREKFFSLLKYPYRITMNLNMIKKIVDEFAVFNFYAGYSLIPVPLSIPYFHFLRYTDIKFLKNKGKKIFMHFQGCDLRTKEDTLKDDNGISCCNDCKIANTYCSFGNIKKRKKILFERILPYVDGIIVTTPDLKLIYPEAHVIPKPYIRSNLFNYKIKIFGNDVKRGSLKIIHAPSKPEIKGTKYIVEAINQLKSEGYKIELILVQNMPRSKVFELANEADIAIDQLLVGWYGTFAVEMMSLGIPTLVYIDKRAEDVWPYMKPPVINCNIYNLKDSLKNLIENKEILKEISQREINFVKEVHDPKKLALEMIKIYKGVGLNV